MTTYIGILEKEHSTLWGVWFPDLVGCIAAAQSSEEVLNQVGDALSQWIDLSRGDGQQIPPARSMEELRQDAEVQHALARGHVPVIVTLPVDLLGFDETSLNAIDAKAAERGVTRLDFVREAVLEKIVS